VQGLHRLRFLLGILTGVLSAVCLYCGPLGWD
jgi:hypothetical protein